MRLSVRPGSKVPHALAFAPGPLHAIQRTPEEVSVKQALDKRRSAIALWAVLVLVVHTFVSAWAGAAMAAQPMYDTFGNPLCVTSVVSDDGSTGGDHAKLPNCCVFGCAAASAAVDAPQDVVIATLAPSLEATILPEGLSLRDPRPDARGPGSPRAPPIAV